MHIFSSTENDNQKKGNKKIIIKRSSGSKMPKPNKFWTNFFSVLLILLVLVLLYSFITENQTKPELIALSQVAVDVNSGVVKDIKVKGNDLDITYQDGTEKTSKKETNTALTDTLVNYGVSTETLKNVAIEVTNPKDLGYWLLNLLPILIPVLLLVFFLYFLSRQVKGAGMQAFTFGQSKARMTSPSDKKQRVTFRDVAGAKEAKEELTEVVDFLKNPKKFLEIGARIPKGILLMGAPGTGKTLLARAVAGEAGVSFFSISGSEFVEMFVGVGASRVRDLFKMAKHNAPAIIFMDEIDAVGRSRGSGVGGGNDEREQTLNQILVEMDGFEPNEKVIVMAATNRPDVLDPALLRPGRFDRRVTIDLPDRSDREAILNIHSEKKPLAEDVNFTTIAERTPGFSGADLANLTNEAAILAAREDRKKISQFDLVRSIEKVMLGPERKSHILNKKEKEITAYHEAGHALVASVLPYADPVHKVSIISRGRAAGYTLKLPLEDRRLHSKREFLDDLAVTIAGYVVEKRKFNDVTTGPSNDLQVMTSQARDMVTRYGMSDSIGTVAFEGSDRQVLMPGTAVNKEYSEEIGAKIDSEVSRMIKEAYGRAEQILIDHSNALEAIAAELIEKETIEREEFEKILTANGIKPKKKEDIEHQE